MPQKPTVRFLLSRPQFLIALGLGTGLSPAAPGSIGSLLGFVLFWVLHDASVTTKLASYLILVAIGAWCCTVTGAALQQQDHDAIVFDEIVGMSLVLEFTPGAAIWWSIAFLLFRFFDIAKPWPINLVNNATQNGWTVMLDDVLAAGYAALSVVAVANLA